MVKTAEEVRKALAEQGVHPTVINGRFIKPIDEEAVAEACRTHRLIITMEENVAAGGYGEAVAAYMQREHFANDFYLVSIPDRFVEHGSVEQLKQDICIDAASIVKGILERIR